MQQLNMKKQEKLNHINQMKKNAETSQNYKDIFEKVFSSVSKTRKIVFSYGDASLPEFIYKEEEGIITDVQSRFDIKSSTIDYIVSAQSTASLSVSGTYTFINSKPKKEVIADIEKNEKIIQ